ncbi:hypothetical protein [Dokdonella sp.]|uniref:hypothetical protein n=1 Tax=Dokdonella sp. TaxID=2291710 RepID=UPI003C50C909
MKTIAIASRLTFTLAVVSFAGTVSAQLYINGPLDSGPITDSGTVAPSGFSWSEVQHDDGVLTEANTLSGVSMSVTTTTIFRGADDFIVPAGQAWTLTGAVLFTYQTGYAGTISPVTDYTLRIWDGIPDDPGSNIICGDETTNVLVSSTSSGLYRVFNSVAPPPGSTAATNRLVWRSKVAIPAACGNPGQFTPGTYWLDWNSTIALAAAHFDPPVTVVGARNRPGDNARQRIAGGVWQAVIDVGNPDLTAADLPVDFPFQLLGFDESDGIFRDGFDPSAPD